MDEQIEHVVDAVFDGVIGMGAVDGEPAVAPHVRGDAAEAEGGEAARLVRASYAQLQANRGRR